MDWPCSAKRPNAMARNRCLFSILLSWMRRLIVEPLIDFCLDIGLPVTLEEIGRNSICQGQHLEIAIGAYVLGETIHNEPHDVAAERVVWALKAADAEGRRRKAMHEDEEVFMALAAV